ncbi:hypothetical protein vseg_013509 [Gypsophila vaccaria]
MWGHSDKFKEIVADVWRTPMYGLTVFQVIKKLKLLKQPLRQINRGQFADIETMALKALANLQEKETLLQSSPADRVLIQEETEAAAQYEMLAKARNIFLAQKATSQWVKEGDDKTSFFHCCIKARRRQNKVMEILDMEGVLYDTTKQINQAYETYYMAILGAKCTVSSVHHPTVALGMTVTEEHLKTLSEPVQ